MRPLAPAVADGGWLDVGSGDGRFVHDLATTLGIEPGRLCVAERSAAAVGSAPPEVAAVRASSATLPFADRAVAVVSAFEVIEHLPVPMFARTLDELSRVADRHVALTVPNRERTARANVRCPRCGCQFNPSRHLRSFRPSDMADLVPGFRLLRVAEFGHRAYWYPRPARRALEVAGLLHRPGSPVCPQCEHRWGADDRPTAADDAPGDEPAGSGSEAPDPPSGTPTPAGRSLAHRGYRVARRLAPRARHPYVLGAVYERR